MTERRGMYIKSYRQVLRLFLLQNLEQDRKKPIDSVRVNGV